MNDLFSSEALWAGLLLLIIGGAVASWFTERVRLQEWADAQQVRIVKKEWGWHLDAATGTSRFVGRGGRAHRIVVEDSSRHAYTACIRIGGIFAALLGREPTAVWEGESPKKADPGGTDNSGASPRRV